MIQGIGDTRAKVVDLGLLAAGTGVKHALFCFVEMVLIDMIHLRIKDILIHNRFECLTKLEVLVNKVDDDVCKNPNLIEMVLEITNFNKTKANLVKHGNIVEPRTQVALSSTASEDGSIAKLEHICRHLGKTLVVKAHQLKVKKSKKQPPCNSPTQLKVNSQSTASQYTLSNSNSSVLENKAV